MRYLLVLLIPLIAAGCTVTTSGTTPAISISATEQPNAAAVVNAIKNGCGIEANFKDVVAALAAGVPYGTTALQIAQIACHGADAIEVRGRRSRNVTVVINGKAVRARLPRS